MTAAPCQTCLQPAALRYIEGAPHWWPNSRYSAWWCGPEVVEGCARLKRNPLGGCCNSGARGTRREAIEGWEAAKG